MAGPTDPVSDAASKGSSIGAIKIVEPLCAVFRRKLKTEGAKYTPERAQILDAVMRIEGIFEADHLLDVLRGHGQRVSKATVYRTIKLMLDAGILQRVLFDGDAAQYQLIYGTRPSDLIVRLDTGEAIAVDVPELLAIRQRVCEELGLEAQGHRFQIFAIAKGSTPPA